MYLSKAPKGHRFPVAIRPSSHKPSKIHCAAEIKQKGVNNDMKF